MKRFLLYILACFALIGCVDDFEHVQGSGKFQVVGRITTYGDRDVATRSAKTSEEAYISNMLLFICDATGTIQYSEFVDANNPIFAIDGDAYGKVNYSVNVIANLSAADKTALIQTITENGQSKQKLKSSFTTYKEGVNTTANLFNYKFSVNTAQAQDANGQSATTILLERPTTGFPMVGGYIFKAKPSAGALIEIPLDCLFAKITFNMRIVPTQNGSREQFEMTSWQVHNLPDKVRLGYPAIPAADQSLSDPEIHISTQGVASAYYSSTVRDDYSGKNPIFQTVENDVEVSRQLSFTFYMPENMIVPPLKSNNEPSYSYPDGIDQDSKQHFKPEIYTKTGTNKQNPTYVEIKGIYTNHQGHTRDITYKVFLGKDNWSNFQIKRNGHYTNDITIRGITNNDAGHGVTLDHRVNVKYNNLIKLEIERETLLDCHWEIRPIRIEFDEDAADDSRVVINLPAGCNWLSLESPANSNANQDKYCECDASSTAFGKRRYFTQNLVSETLNSANNKTIIIQKGANDHTKATLYGKTSHTVWAYIDEYATTGSSVRSATLTVTYYEKSKTQQSTNTRTELYTIKQKNLYQIDYNKDANQTRTYYIENYEEYLYNFDSKEEYGKTSNGMEWGLNGVQLSENNRSIVVESDVIGESDAKATNYAFEKIRDNRFTENRTNNNNPIIPFFDFYNYRDINTLFIAKGWKQNELVNTYNINWRTYGGYGFTKSIKSKKGQDNNYIIPENIPTNGNIDSAIAYCLNKNKRLEDGTIPNEFKWYVPSIEEIEEICIGGYEQFEEFRNNYYWSSQPAYQQHFIEYNRGVLENKNGRFYTDDTNRARATKVNEQWASVNSGVTQNYMYHYFYKELGDRYLRSYKNYKNEDGSQFTNSNYEEGNRPRTGDAKSINRVRCVYYSNVIASDGEKLDGDAIYVPESEGEILANVDNKNIYILWSDKEKHQEDNNAVFVNLTGVSSSDLETKIKNGTKVTFYLEITNKPSNNWERLAIVIMMGFNGKEKKKIEGFTSAFPKGKFQVTFNLDQEDIEVLKTKEDWRSRYIFTIRVEGNNNNFGLKLYAITYENP